MTHVSNLPAPAEPVLARTDFLGWSRDSVETLALELLADNQRLRQDIRVLLDAHRSALLSISAGLDGTLQAARAGNNP